MKKQKCVFWGNDGFFIMELTENKLRDELNIVNEYGTVLLGTYEELKENMIQFLKKNKVKIIWNNGIYSEVKE